MVVLKCGLWREVEGDHVHGEFVVPRGERRVGGEDVGRAHAAPHVGDAEAREEAAVAEGLRGEGVGHAEDEGLLPASAAVSQKGLPLRRLMGSGMREGRYRETHHPAPPPTAGEEEGGHRPPPPASLSGSGGG